MQFNTINKIYANCESIHLKNHRVRYAKLNLLRRSIIMLRKALGENENELFWLRPLRILRNYQFTSIWAPVPLNNPLLINSGQMGILNDTLDKVESIYPSHSKLFNDCFRLLQDLYNEGDNPLYDCMKDLLSNNTRSINSIIVLLHKPRAQEVLSKIINSSMDEGEIPHVDFSVLSPQALKTFPIADEILLFGPFSLYEKKDFVFSSPSANYFHTINYAWFKDSVTIDKDFNGSLGGPPMIENDGYSIYGKDKADISEIVIEKTPTDPILEVEVHSKRIEVSGLEVEVMATLFLLEEDKAVWLDDSENKKSIVINPNRKLTDGDYDVSEFIENRRNNMIEEGDYLILRHKGDGDYIADYADTILGDRVEESRELQKLWKEKLREKVRESSTIEIAIKLLDLGSKIANEPNLRNWMSFDNIKTFYKEDFAAIMKLIDLEGKQGELWDNAARIHSAHIQAGQEIRHELFRVMKRVNILDIQKSGFKEIHLDDQNVGSLVIIRVIQRTENKQKLPRRLLPLYSNIEI